MKGSNIQELKKNDWPSRLLEIPQPPEKLYIRGKMPDWNQKFLAVVGARKYTNYGKEACETLIEGLTGHPITVVSGLALGIDGIAHRAALSAGLNTIAVPGSGLSDKVLYPSSHQSLAHSIIDAGGTLISEFEPDFKATVWSFPQRNRIMAGMSHAVLVIEAEKKSGTLITARLATEYNRDVFTVPGSIFSPTSEGPHLLIRLGATPVTSSKDILEAFGFAADEEKSGKKNYDDCSKEELKIIEALVEPMDRDSLIRVLGLPAHEINSLLSLLEIKGHIKESSGEICLI